MTIAVAHQQSETSRLALLQAVTEGKTRGCDLAVLHVVGEALDADRREAYRLGIADEIEKVVGADCVVPWTLHLRASAGDVGDGLVHLADQVGAEILVIGARRRSPMGKALMGSVAQTVILEANMPVLVVKAPA